MKRYEGYHVYTETEFLAQRGTPEALIGMEAIYGAWKDFMHEDNLANRLWDEYKRVYGEDQLYICNPAHQIIARAESISLYWDDEWQNLPAGGWDWALETGVLQAREGIQPNVMCAIAIVIVPQYQGQGLSRLAIALMRQRAQEKGYTHLIAPVRPSQKALYPLMPMARYAQWRRADGQHVDAWLRTHEKLGARIIKVAPNSMLIQHPVANWAEWTGLRFDFDGDYIVDGALNPVVVRDGIATYTEPNIWMLHAMGG